MVGFQQKFQLEIAFIKALDHFVFNLFVAINKQIPQLKPHSNKIIHIYVTENQSTSVRYRMYIQRVWLWVLAHEYNVIADGFAMFDVSQQLNDIEKLYAYIHIHTHTISGVKVSIS